MIDAADSERERPPNLAEAVGGPVGIAESALPAIAFVVAYSASGQNTNTAAVVAVGLALVLTIVRLARRESPLHALSGLVGVAFAAFIARQSGRAENFFLPGLFFNAGYAMAFLVSLAIKRPLVGVIVGQLDGEGSAWRSDPARVRAFARGTWLWAGVFLLRLLVQLPLYLAGAVVALGVARTAMGLPLFAVGLWLTWIIVRSSRVTRPAPSRAT
ncbi:MAG: DUF3159 domain-containing protein [Actinomycetota bacterium]|nr:DUF3159 domain-containing protein [Actinomycetota bacterium]